MATNFDQKQLLETNNTPMQSPVSGFGKFFWYALFILIIPIFIHIGKRNWFRATKEEAVEQLGNIDAKLTQRFETLEKQLVTAQAALDHEASIFKEVAAIRTSATTRATSLKDVEDKNAAISNVAGRFNAVLENYPQVQAMPIMQQLNATVRELERDIEATRRFYSAIARKFNTGVQTYPNNVVAASMHIVRLPVFEANDAMRVSPPFAFKDARSTSV